MQDFIQSYFKDHQALAQRVASELTDKILDVGQLLCSTFAAGGKLITLGNGGSAADAQHFAEELIGRFKRTRRPLPAISVTSDGTALTCIANDFGYSDVFARQVQALANKGDIVLGISTSGDSENVLRALQIAQQNDAIPVALLGRDGGKIAKTIEHKLIIPTTVTSHIQEMHITIIHILCEIVDRWAAGEK